MASFMDMLNQGLGNLTGTPLGQIGTQLLLASGPQQGNPSMGNRLGQALGGMGQMQMQQQAMEQTKTLRDIQMATLARQKRQLDMEETQRSQILSQLEDPNFMADNPGLREALRASQGDIGMAAQIAKANPGLKPPSMKQTYDQYNPDGSVTQKVYNYQTNQYDTGATYTPTAQQRQNLEAQYRPQEFDLKAQNAETVRANAEAGQAKVELARDKEAREAAAALKKSNIDFEQLRQGYTGANSQIGEVISDIDQLTNHPGFNSLFGPNGMVTPVPGTEAADAKALYDQLAARLTLSEVARLNDAGVKLNPMSNLDLETIRASATGLNKATSDAYAKDTLTKIRGRLDKSRNTMAENFNRMSGLYQPQQQSQSGQQQATIVRTGTAPDGRKVVEYSDGRIEYAN